MGENREQGLLYSVISPENIPKNFNGDGLDIKTLNPLIISEDVTDIKEYQDGYLVVKREAFRIISPSSIRLYDFAAGHIKTPREIKDFYLIPIMSCYPGDADFIIKSVFEQFKKTKNRRYLVKVPDKRKTFMVDIGLIEEGVKLCSDYYYSTDDETLSKSGSQSLEIKKNIEGIVKELSSRLQSAV